MCCIVCVQDFGKYGFIRESDMAAKQAEFMLWATEVKGANVELLGRLEEKELFKEYMEDFNTGTLKHRWARGDTGTWSPKGEKPQHPRPTRRCRHMELTLTQAQAHQPGYQWHHISALFGWASDANSAAVQQSACGLDF